jgi:hypothetical protein
MTWSFAYPSNWAAVIVVFEPAPSVAIPGLAQQAASSVAFVSSLNIDLARAPAPGSTVVVCIDSMSRASTVRGGGVSNWQLAQAANSSVWLLLRARSEIWTGVVDGAANRRITVEGDLRYNSISAIASEWSGTATAPISVGASTSGFGGTFASPVVTSQLPANANDIVIATAGVGLGLNRISPASGLFTSLVGPAPRLLSGVAAAYVVPTSSSDLATGWTVGYPTVWASCIVRIHR